ncbi:MAG: tagaturonate reductase [Clostridia bacterium]|nr:tagaturonate reductase [Clostridia bacterium]
MNFNTNRRPIRVIQFGGGVFLRGFFNWMMQKSIEKRAFDGNAVIVRSRTRGIDPLETIGYCYTHIARDGAHEDVTPINCISGSISAAEDYRAFLKLAENAETDIIVSNTTEAGIVYEACPMPTEVCPESYPAKLTALLYHRYRTVGNGMLILPCELIENNGAVLREYVWHHASDWGLEKGFFDWLEKDCSFRNTLVDRIVSGTSTEDETINCSEYFHLFVIEGEEDPRLPFRDAGLNVKWVPSVVPYRTIKVRILNGAHTSMIPYALLCGAETVHDCLQDPRIRAHLSQCLDEIVDSLSVPREAAEAYAKDVLERFANPHIRHLCASVSLNSVSKFRVRVLPSILEYREKFGVYPRQLLFSFGKLIDFYQNGTPKDASEVIEWMRSSSVAEILTDQTVWGTDLSDLCKEVEADANPSVR